MNNQYYPSPNLFSSASEYNKRLNDYLRTTKVLNKELINSFDEAYSYQTVSTVNWLISKLKILDQRITNNEVIKFGNDFTLCGREEWIILIGKRYPGIIDEFN